jgi:hypothetical protein
MWTRKLITIALAAVLGGSLAACTVRGSGHLRTTGVVYVEEAPPPPRRVVVVQRPGYVWIEGRWAYNGGRWAWNDGYYQRARADHHWVDGRWERRGRGHVWVDGRWEARGRARGQNRPRHQDHRR